MMNDRERLELAAKAAGLKIDKSPHNGGGARNDGFDILGNAVLDWHNNKTWNPLTDDGDALRLAVKLGLQVYGRDIGCAVDDGKFFDEADYGGDPYAATRRAIVCAAAEIGKAK